MRGGQGLTGGITQKIHKIHLHMYSLFWSFHKCDSTLSFMEYWAPLPVAS